MQWFGATTCLRAEIRGWRRVTWSYIELKEFCANLASAQKHSAGLTAMTERTLGAKAGHLELLKGGKKNKDGVVKKGGSKKFG